MTRRSDLVKEITWGLILLRLVGYALAAWLILGACVGVVYLILKAV